MLNIGAQYMYSKRLTNREESSNNSEKRDDVHTENLFIL